MKVKILIIRFSSIGDIVLTTPIVRCLKKQMEGDVEIHYLTKKAFLPVLEANPYLTKIHVIEDKVSEVKPALLAEEFDFIVDLHHNLRSMQAKKGLRGLALSLDKINWQKWLMVNFKINKMPKKHIVDRYFDVCRPLGVENDGLGLDYFIPKNDEVGLEMLPETHRKGYVGFVIGGSYETKKLPVEKIISICRKIQKPVVLLGGKNDAENAAKISAKAGGNIYNACGKYNINQSASLVKQADKIITHDTGLMHIAAAFQKEIISIWGNTIPEFGMYPYLPKNNGLSKIIEVKDLRCRPCSKLGYNKCPKKYFYCMNLIDDSEIVG